MQEHVTITEPWLANSSSPAELADPHSEGGGLLRGNSRRAVDRTEHLLKVEKRTLGHAALLMLARGASKVVR
jgi:hypothetical protein